MQNAAARLVCNSGKRISSTNLLSRLHWLEIEKRILFKIILLTHKYIWARCSENLVSLIQFKNYNRSADDYLFQETTTYNTKYGKRCFRFIAPRLWNCLPRYVREEENTDIFKKKVKTLLFSDAESHNVLHVIATGAAVQSHFSIYVGKCPV